MTELTNTRSERVKAVRTLSGRSARSRTGLFLVEGPQGVREVVAFEPARVQDLYVTAAADDRYAEITSSARQQDRRVHLVSDEVLLAMSADAQGILAVVQQGDHGPDQWRAAVAASPRLVAVLSNVRDPGNAGTVIRAADAAGADLVVLAGESVDVHNPKVVRSTAGSLFHLPVVSGVQLDDAVDALREAGIQVLATDGSGDLDLDDLLDVVGRSAGVAHPGPVPGTLPDLAGPTAWVFGNEAWGLRPHERALADAVVRVPLRGRAESLNLATAATVCLYASARAQR